MRKGISSENPNLLRCSVVMKIGLLLFFITLRLLATPPLEKVSVQFEWKHQFEFAGFYAALEKGYYRDVGLDVTFKEYENGINIAQDVQDHKATYGLYNNSLMIEDHKVHQLVLLATYLQHSPLIFVAQKGIKTPADMINKTIMATQDEFENSALSLLLAHFMIHPGNARFIDHTYNTEAFIKKQIDVMSAFSSNELYSLNQHHVEYEIIDPIQYGFTTTAQNLFTTVHEVMEHPDRTKNFVEATNKGWEYALDHKDEMIDLILKKYNTQHKTKEALRFEANEIERLFMRKFFKIGEVNKELTFRIFKQLKQTGALFANEELGEFTMDEILEHLHTKFNLSNQEQQFLMTKDSIKMCVDPDWYPFEAIKNGKHIGIAADVMQEFSKMLSIPITFVPVKSWTESIQKAKNKECDILSLASATPERITYMDFTPAYVNLPIVVATKMDQPFTDGIAQLFSKKLAVVKDYAIEENLKRKYPELQLVEVASITEGLKKVYQGEVYGYVDNLMVVSNYIQKDYTGILKVSNRLDEHVELGVGTRKDEPELHTIFEKLVKQLDPAWMQKVYDKWAPTVQEVKGLDTTLVIKIVLVFTIFSLLFYWRYTLLNRYNQKLLRLSTTDPLTTLANRTKIDDKLIEEFKRINRYEHYTFSVILLDIDYFKKINDTFGHLMGDKILKQLSALLVENTRDTDIVGRWGGEEFIIVLPHTNIEQALQITRKLHHTIENNVFEKNISLTASFGIGEAHHDLDLNNFLDRIDQALYHVKENGRNGIKIL